ncbi:MAG: hypothetical protein ACRC5G_03320 [Cetobacterium sp.]
MKDLKHEDRIVLLLALSRMYLEQSEVFIDRNVFRQSAKSGIKNTAKDIERGLDFFFKTDKITTEQKFQINDYITNVEVLFEIVFEKLIEINTEPYSDEILKVFKERLKELVSEKIVLEESDFK